MTQSPTSNRPRRSPREPGADGDVPVREACDVDDAGIDAQAGAVRTPSKTTIVLDLLARQEGASIEELIAATGWLPHSTRAALTGLRKKGHAITRDKVEGVTRYAIATGDGE